MTYVTTSEIQLMKLLSHHKTYKTLHTKFLCNNFILIHLFLIIAGGIVIILPVPMNSFKKSHCTPHSASKYKGRLKHWNALTKTIQYFLHSQYCRLVLSHLQSGFNSYSTLHSTILSLWVFYDNMGIVVTVGSCVGDWSVENVIDDESVEDQCCSVLHILTNQCAYGYGLCSS